MPHSVRVLKNYALQTNSMKKLHFIS